MKQTNANGHAMPKKSNQVTKSRSDKSPIESNSSNHPIHQMGTITQDTAKWTEPLLFLIACHLVIKRGCSRDIVLFMQHLRKKAQVLHTYLIRTGNVLLMYGKGTEGVLKRYQKGTTNILKRYYGYTKDLLHACTSRVYRGRRDGDAGVGLPTHGRVSLSNNQRGYISDISRGALVCAPNTKGQTHRSAPTLLSIFIFVFVSCVFNNQSLAQSPNGEAVTEVTPLKVGDRVSESFWTTPFTYYDHEGSQTKTMERYKGKNILIGFWSIYCGACLSSFPFLNEVQAAYSDNLIVLPVNSYDKDLAVIDQVLARFDASYRIPSILYDSYFKRLFPHHAVPQYIWITTKGDIEAITGKAFLTMDNISAFLERHGKI